MKRRGFFRTLLGTAVATVAAPLIPTTPNVVTGMPFLGGYIYCPYIPLYRTIHPTLLAKEIVGVHPMSAPTGTVFHLNKI